MEYQDIRYDLEPPNAILTIDRPQRLNAFRGRTVEELIHAFHRAWTDPEVRCAILTGAGERAFCVGGDQKEYVEHGSYGTSENGLFEIERDRAPQLSCWALVSHRDDEHRPHHDAGAGVGVHSGRCQRCLDGSQR